MNLPTFIEKNKVWCDEILYGLTRYRAAWNSREWYLSYPCFIIVLIVSCRRLGFV